MNLKEIANDHKNKTLVQRDRELIWHPFTQEKTDHLPFAITKGKGAYVFDEQGNKYLDLISSWWVNLHGHGNTEIASSIYNQAKELEHILFAGFTHAPAVNLCEMLNEILPTKLSKFFFSDNGSTAVEVSLKMSLQYWHNKGEKQRNLFLSFEGGYHGDTFGAMSVGRSSGYHDPFGKLLFEVLTLPFPETWNGDENVESKESECLKILHQYLDVHSNEICGIILEPIIQGAGGMRMCRPEFLKDLLSVLRWHNVLIIFDEVMTGFGRTGSNFALDHIGITPDFLCLSKGITGGFLPLAVTVTSKKIYDAFYSDEWKHAFTHGHSYTANPIACAAAVKSLELLLMNSTKQAIQSICEIHKKGIEYIKSNCDNTIKHRSFGTISAFEVDIDIKELNLEMKNRFMDAGLLIRPLGSTIYLLPPYCVKHNELEKVYHRISDILNDI